MTKIKRNYLYNISYQVLAIILPFITTPYISRVLGVEAIGKYSYGYSIAYYFAMFAHLGLSNYGNREIAKVSNDKDKCAAVFWSIYGFQFLNSLMTFIAYIIYCCWCTKDVKIAFIFSMTVVASIFDVTWFFYGTEKFKLTIIRNTIIKLMGTLGIFLFVKTESDLWLYCIIIAGSSLLSQLTLWPYVFYEIDRKKIVISDVVQHVKPALVLFVPVIAISLYKYMDKIMLGIISGNIELGYYENAEKINQLPSIFIISLGTVMLPRVTNLVSKGDNKKARSYTNNSITFAMFLSSALSFGLMAVSAEFIPIFLGEGYSRCERILNILLFSSIFVAVANVIRTQILIPYKKDNTYVISVVLGAVINLICNIILIDKLGAVGAAFGTLVAEIIVCLVQIVVAKKEKLFDIKSIIEAMPFILFGYIMFLLLQTNIFQEGVLLTRFLFKTIVGAIIYLILSGIYYISYIKKRIR